MIPLLIVFGASIALGLGWAIGYIHRGQADKEEIAKAHNEVTRFQRMIQQSWPLQYASDDPDDWRISGPQDRAARAQVVPLTTLCLCGHRHDWHRGGYGKCDTGHCGCRTFRVGVHPQARERLPGSDLHN